jgi:heme/copper-type cytochrome/quinol oxidase subunit 2
LDVTGGRSEEGAAAQAHSIGESVVTVMTTVAVRIFAVVVMISAVVVVAADAGAGAAGMIGRMMEEGVGMGAALRGVQEAQ